ncbi:MAG: hypothetical protein ACM3IH_16210 [Sphingobacteriales bacterium]|jgi:hypothetical protein
MFLALGLEKHAGRGESDYTTTNTDLGHELDAQLVMTFMGVWDEEKLPIFLCERGLIDDEEADHLIAVFGEPGWEETYKASVRRAYTLR